MEGKKVFENFTSFCELYEGLENIEMDKNNYYVQHKKLFIAVFSIYIKTFL